MLHKFLPSIKKDISYCSHCGCLSYKNIPSKNNNPSNLNNCIIKSDPLAIKYKPIIIKYRFFNNISYKLYKIPAKRTF